MDKELINMAHAGGAPLKYTLEEIECGIKDFWNYVADNGVVPTLERLCDILDCDNETLKDYEHREQFSASIKRCKQRILACKVEKLNDTRNPAGIIFDLKNNYHYTDKTESDINIGNLNGKPFELQSRLNQLSVEELKRLAEIEE